MAERPVTITNALDRDNMLGDGTVLAPGQQVVVSQDEYHRICRIPDRPGIHAWRALLLHRAGWR